MRASRGFTLIELLTVMTVLAIMLAVAVPSFANFTASQRVRSASYEISTSLLLARSEAVKRNAQIKVAPATGSDWATGWNVTVNSDGTLLQNQRSANGITITQNPSANIIFQGTGRPTAAAKTYWQIASSTGTATSRCVTLDTAGVASSSAGSCP